jgi:hypothetical protein
MNSSSTTASQIKGFSKFLSTSSSIYLNGRRLYANEITCDGETFSVGSCSNLSIYALVNGHGYNLFSLYLTLLASRKARSARY